MATVAKKGELTYIDNLGNKTIMYPYTKMECITDLNIKSTTKTITIAASDWQDGYYTLFDPLITSATSNQEWMEPLATDSNKAMRDMLCAANLKDVAQDVGWTKVRCEGTVPTSDVEVRICFRGEK